MKNLLIISVLSAFLLHCGPGKEAPKPPSPAPVTAVRALQKDVPVKIDAIGTVEARQTVSVRSLIAGEIFKINFRDGQDVKKGELLFVIDPRPIQASLNQAEANLKKDIAQLKFASIEKDRYAQLAAKGLIAREQADQMSTQAATLAETVKADKAVVDNYRVQLTYCYIHAPITGRAGAILVDLGNVVKVNDTVLVVINQIQPINVTFTIPERNLAEVKQFQTKEGLPVEVSARGNSGQDSSPTAEGRLFFIDNTVDPATGTIRLKAEFPNKGRGLWPGEFVNVSMTLTMRAGAVVIPSQALQAGQQGQFVFVVRENSTVEARNVVVDFPLDGESVISEGIAPGEIVVTDGQINLAPGRRVNMNPPALQGSQPG